MACLTTCYVYLMQVTAPKGDRAYKIGVSTKPKARRHEMQYCCPWKLVIRKRFPQTGYQAAMDCEAELHVMFAERHIQGEWFALLKEDIERIESYFAEKLKRGQEAATEN